MPETNSTVIDRLAPYLDPAASFFANLASATVDELKGIRREATAILAAYEKVYAKAIADAEVARNLAAMGGKAAAVSAWDETIRALEQTIVKLTDNAWTAAERIAEHDRYINNGFHALGRYIGPAFDSWKVFDAIASQDAAKSSEAVVSIAYGSVGAYIGGAIGTIVAPGLGTAIGAGVGSAVSAWLADELKVSDRVVFPVLTWLGSNIPDGFWRGFDSLTYGVGSARLSPKEAALFNLVLLRLDGSVASAPDYKYLDVAGNSRTEREVVKAFNHVARQFMPGSALLADDATVDQVSTFAAQLESATDTLRGKTKISTEVPTELEARDSFSVFISLLVLSPYQYKGIDDSSRTLLESTLGASWGDVFVKWQADKTLPDSSRTFSDAWLSDRRKMLVTIGRANTLNNDQLLTRIPGIDAGLFADGDLGRVTTIAGGNGIEVRFGGKNDNILIAPPIAKVRTYGDDGNDQIAGGSFADYLEGGAGNDNLSGGAGSDTLRGGEGVDYLDGGAESDFLHGGEGNDEIVGGLGSDYLIGGAGADKLKGGSDNDFVFDQGGSDTNQLWGDAGTDVLEVREGTGIVLMDGGADNDVLRGSVGSNGNNLIGGTGNDHLRGGDKFDILFGDSDGTGVVTTADGADFIEGGGGDDRITGGGGADLLHGGTGSDTYYFTTTGFGTDVMGSRVRSRL